MSKLGSLTVPSLVEVVKEFKDFDGVTVSPGTYPGEIVRRGYSKTRRNWFWNIVSEGRVIAVTLGHPPRHKTVEVA